MNIIVKDFNFEEATATVVTEKGFWIFKKITSERFRCIRTGFFFAKWISLDNGRALWIDDPEYDLLNDAGRAAQLNARAKS